MSFPIDIQSVIHFGFSRGTQNWICSSAGVDHAWLIIGLTPNHHVVSKARHRRSNQPLLLFLGRVVCEACLFGSFWVRYLNCVARPPECDVLCRCNQC